MAGKKGPRGPQKGTSLTRYQAMRKARLQYQKAKRKPLGEGSRAAAVGAAAKAWGAKNPGGIIYKAGVKKHGKKKFLAMARKGRIKKGAHPGKGYIKG